MDITEKKYLTLFDNFVSSLVILDKEFKITFFNKPFSQLTGFNIKRIKKGSFFFDYFPLDSGKNLFYQVLNTGQMSANIELESKDKDGQDIKVLTNIIPLGKGEETVGLLLNMIDVSVEDKLHKKYKKLLDKEIEAKKDIQMQLIQAEKMASLGTLVSGICHELNNPLAIIMGSSELIKAKDSSKDNRLFDSIVDATKRMSTIVSKLRIFSMKSDEQFEFVAINGIIEDILLLFNKKCEDEKITIKTDLAKENPKVLGDQNLIGQVFLNIMTNAIDAMEKCYKKHIEIKTILDRELLKIIISDTGVGISEDVKDKIFDPFFTTKAPNKGTGLGLSIVYQILKLHNASIEIKDNAEGGTTFELLFNSVIGTKSDKEMNMLYSKLKNISIVFVDDEQNLLSIIDMMLKEHFSKIFTASNGIEALKILKDNKIDLIITDVRMPEMDGYDLAKESRKLYPKIPIISLSGSETVKSDPINSELFDYCITKPFNKMDILSASLDVLKLN